MKTFKQIVFEGIGEASMCWSETPAGVFDSTKALGIGDKIVTEYNILETKNAILEARMAIIKKALE